MASTRHDPRYLTLAVLVALTLVGGGVLLFFGVGSQLSEERDLQLTVLVTELSPEVAEKVHVGDLVYTDPGGMVIGEIVEAHAGPDVLSVPDQNGELHAAEDPVLWRVEVVIAATGRQSDEIVALDNEVVQAGQFYSLISRDYYLRGMVTDVDVR